ncbi:HD-GYP domain-containing protein [Piscinibacter koreensis]|uniref:DUF3391 domain-containing protein n=1 Tax=Piscinibacter koreensis TaxID=2742824 RepID=A0A7Y6NKP5_9BURK|nr:HD-GYP domain-containing protein [Schlegelella koreensis]NUZ04856.1 DUF3391 domain-containing protein [Schlegelella koreensis]
MKVAHPDLIDVQALRVGMFVHLDMGWMSHPFPTSSFKISSPAQIATIRSLGLKRVYWSPQQSDATVGGVVPAQTRPADLVDAAPPGAARATANADVAEVPTDEVAAAEAAQREARERAMRRRRLVVQRAAQKAAQRQYAAATQAFKQAAALVLVRPADARAEAETLTRTLIDKMVGDGELTVRLLTESTGDNASAHAVNVSVVSMLMGRCFGFDEAELLDLGLGALLHDIGKIKLPSRLHHFDESLLPSEKRAYREHVALGAALAESMQLTPGATAVIEQHHEAVNGSGFPAGLNGDRITLAARIVALVNRYDKLCNPPAAARALTPHEALSTLFANGQATFDATLLNRFIKMMGVYPPGSTVQLTDDRYAMVVSVNSTRPLKPRVLVYEPSVPREEALHLDLETADGIGVRRSIKPTHLPRPALDYLAPAQRVAYFFEPFTPELEPA